MVRKRPVSTFTETTKPIALIIGGGTVSSYLIHTLEDRSCKVVIQDSYKPMIGKFDYIFQFGNFHLAKDILFKHLRENGKYLFIEFEEEEKIGSTDDNKIRIIRVGEINFWSIPVLVDNILRAMFSLDGPNIMDIRKKAQVKRKVLPKKKETVKEELYGITDKKNQKIPTFPTEKSDNHNADHSPLSIKKATSMKVIATKRIALFFLLVVLVISLVGGSLYFYINSLKKIYTDFKSDLASSNWAAVSLDITQAEKHLQIARKIYDYSYKILIPFRNTSYLKDFDTILTVNEDLLKTGKETLVFFQKFKPLSYSAFSDDNKITKADFDRSISLAENLTQVLTDARKKMDATAIPYFPKDTYALLLSSYLDKLSVVHQVLPFFEQVLITDGEKTYLLLFQNNMEIRATGGFIGSIGLLMVKDGSINKLNIMDVYTVDGQLKGHVDPPLPIKKYLSQPHWFLRDSNFDPDFAASAVKAYWFLEKELGQKVDGVIGINLFLAEDLLRIMGPVNLPDFNNETINANNFFFKSQYYVEKDFFAGSTSKKDYLTAVSNALQLKLAEGQNLPWLDLLTVLRNSLEEKKITFFSKDDVLQKDIEKAGWAGRMVNVSCVDNKDQNTDAVKPREVSLCLPDYLSVIESNFGVNKANYFVNKSVAIEKKINDSGLVVTILTLSYENSNIPELFKGGDYHNYLRIFVPKDSKLLNATLNNMPISPSEIEVSPYENDKTVFAMMVKIASGNKGAVKISYTLPSLFTKDSTSYQFFYQKQMGDKNSPLVLSVSYPERYSLTPVNFNSTSGNKQEIFYSTDTSVDRIFALENKIR